MLDKERLIQEYYDQMESGLTYMGITAIEDKLQVNTLS